MKYLMTEKQLFFEKIICMGIIFFFNTARGPVSDSMFLNRNFIDFFCIDFN